MADDKEKTAYWKGYNDSKKPNANVFSTLLTGGTFQPSSGHKEAYKAGWSRGKNDKK